ncbi:hypothetical protein [Enterobacillus tribolii]|uniref:Uncharacterized protein n=1 Tax=Enterobacillus tribolii TaxID=1487935 RepID=A0A370QU98_9GAMM|nr:hypothetical protein [Enterobacillus tribolii]RDK92839.1 hypothetical protein C8D90_103232 [Enterobacillus tribolii]
MFLSLLIPQHPLVHNFTLLRIRLRILYMLGLRKRKPQKAKGP